MEKLILLVSHCWILIKIQIGRCMAMTDSFGKKKKKDSDSPLSCWCTSSLEVLGFYTSMTLRPLYI